MKKTLMLMGEIFKFGGIESKSSNRWELFESRVRQACAEYTPGGFINRLASLMQCSGLNQELLAQMLIEEGNSSCVNWIRKNIKVACSLALLSGKDPILFQEAVESINIIDSEHVEGDEVIGTYTPDIPITVNLISPLMHGADELAGNASLFRRTRILAKNGGILDVPFYSGNAVRGRMRDLMADHFTESIGLTPNRAKPPYETWFFYLIYCGGNLSKEIESKASKYVGNRVHGYNIDNQATFRDTFPFLSLFGFALGNSLFPGRFSSCDLLPACREMGNGQNSFKELLSWEYLTRRDDLGSEIKAEEDKNQSMIATAETMKQGAVLTGGFDYSLSMTEIEKSCLHLGIKLLAKSGKLGGSNRRGWGNVEMKINTEDLDSTLYEDFMQKNKIMILQTLSDLGGIKNAGN